MSDWKPYTHAEIRAMDFSEGEPTCIVCGNHNEMLVLQTPGRTSTSKWRWICPGCPSPDDDFNDYWIDFDRLNKLRGESTVDYWIRHLSNKPWFIGDNFDSFVEQTRWFS